MKLVLNSFFIFFVMFCSPVLGESFSKTYLIKSSGIKIGKLDWEVVIDDKKYRNDLRLKSEGVLSIIYNFEGDYSSEGGVENKKLRPTKYTHLWKTNKTTKKMNLVFQNNKLKSLDQFPIEKEGLRTDVFDIKETKDPISSFLQIVMGHNMSLVVDGRRIYTMNAFVNKDLNQKTVELLDYINLWADHKRTKFEKIAFEKKMGEFLPSKILIYFDKRIFKLEEF